jgi:predicted ATPase
MLKKLRIQNFKGWKDTGEITMAPITLFFGANSSGKSSIGQFLMMLKQTVESQDRKAVFYPGGKNSAVQLGSYKEMVFQRNQTNKISFDYSWSLPEQIEIKDPVSKDEFSGDSISFSAEVGFENTLALNSLKYELFKENQSVLSIGMGRKSSGNREYEVKADKDKYFPVRNQGRAWPLGAPVRFYGFPDEVLAYYQNVDFVRELNLRHEKLFRSLYYLGPLRTKAERLYSWSGSEPESVGYAGENTISAILAARNRKIGLCKPSAKRASIEKSFQEVIAMKLKEMGLIEEFEVNPIAKQRQEYEVKVHTKGSNDWVDLPEVGFGISPVLPVLVPWYFAPQNSIILMEQPEINLHPLAQSAMADVMIDVINSKENREHRNIQLIIETHSEHFLRRLQLRIAQQPGAMKGKVAAYFANVSKTPATLDPLQIDPFGNITNWPENFFGDEMTDIIEQSRAALKAQKKLMKSQTSEACQ